MMSRYFLVIGSFFGATGVIFGAFAAHMLKHHLSPYLLGIFQTGVQYQFIHAIVLVLICILGLLPKSNPIAQKYFNRAGFCFTIGVFFFSGSLYLLAMTEIKWFAPVTPIGGLFLIFGWMMMFVAAFKMKEVSQ